MKKLFLSLLALSVIVTGCKKDDDGETKPAIEYLTAHNWEYVSITISPAYDWFHTGTEITDILAPLDDCDKDDLTEFNSDGNYYILFSEIKCYEDEPERDEEGEYSVSEDGKQLTREEFTADSVIKEISDTKLVLETSFTENSVKYTFTEVYIAK
jgi:hypothetical protein